MYTKLMDEIGAEYYINDTTRNYTAAGVARHVKKALARRFAGVKFSVKSSTYSGGCSVSVKWIDGPTSEEVQAITRNYEGAGFDSMTDYKYYVRSWLNPQTLEAGFLNSEYNDEPRDLPAGAVAVSWAGCSMGESRHFSQVGCKAIMAALAEEYGGGFGCNGKVYQVSELVIIPSKYDDTAYICLDAWDWDLHPTLNRFIYGYSLYEI